MSNHDMSQNVQVNEVRRFSLDPFIPTERITHRSDLTDDQVNQICNVIRETSFAIHKFFGTGYREKVYERALVHRLSKAGLAAAVQVRVMIHDEDGTSLLKRSWMLLSKEPW